MSRKKKINGYTRSQTYKRSLNQTNSKQSNQGERHKKLKEKQNSCFANGGETTTFLIKKKKEKNNSNQNTTIYGRCTDCIYI